MREVYSVCVCFTLGCEWSSCERRLCMSEVPHSVCVFGGGGRGVRRFFVTVSEVELQPC